VRITHLSDYYLPRFGGIELQVRDLTRQQAAEGHLVEVVTASMAKGAGDDGDVVVRRRGAHRLVGGLYSPLMFHRMARAVRESKPDVVHAHVSTFTPGTWWGMRAAVKSGIPVVVTVHSMLASIGWLLRALDVLGHWRRWPVTYTAVSSVAAAQVRALLGPDAVVHVVPNGVAPDAWLPATAPPQQPCAPRPARPDGEVTVLAVMRLARRKRGRQLVDAVRSASAQAGPGVRIRLVVAGDGEQRRRLERQVRRLGMTGQVELLGRVSSTRVRELLAEADVFAAPAILESFGIAALEARLAGVPVVARAESGVAGFVRHGHEGLLVNDDAAFARALARLAAQPALRAELSATSRAHAPALGWDVTLAAVARAYEDAAALAGVTPPVPAGSGAW
jgi:phosphatidylinositol alpha 1,6-mannosyltransferase